MRLTILCVAATIDRDNLKSSKVLGAGGKEAASASLCENRCFHNCFRQATTIGVFCVTHTHHRLLTDYELLIEILQGVFFFIMCLGIHLLRLDNFLTHCFTCIPSSFINWHHSIIFGDCLSIDTSGYLPFDCFSNEEKSSLHRNWSVAWLSCRNRSSHSLEDRLEFFNFQHEWPSLLLHWPKSNSIMVFDGVS